MRRNAIVTVVVVLALLALGSQLAIPAYVSSRVEDRLTQDGGTAHVEIHAFPATELIGGGGDRIEVRGRDLRLDPVDEETDVFGRLDGFERVDAELERVRSGPFEVERFTLARDGDGRPYTLSVRATITATDLAEYASSRYGGRLGGWMGRFAGGLLPFDDTPVPIELTAVVRSQDGRAEVVAADGDIAGLPADPIAKTLATALANAL